MSYVDEGAAAVQGETGPVAGTGGAGAPPERRRRSTRERAQRWRLPLMLAAPVLIVLAALYFYLAGGRYAATDDAYVQSARATVASNVPGQVVEIDVHENQFVHSGDVLFRLDPRPFDVAVEQSQAELATASQNIQASQASYAQRGAEIQAAQSALMYAQKELARQTAMAASGVSSQSQLDAAAQAVANDKAQLAAAQQQQANVLASLGGQANGPLAGNASVRTAQAAVDRAKLNQAYGVVRALQDGIVTKVEQLQVGDFINAGQGLFTLAAPRLWVEANFKEDQLAYMRPGQPGTSEDRRLSRPDLPGARGEPEPWHRQQLLGAPGGERHGKLGEGGAAPARAARLRRGHRRHPRAPGRRPERQGDGGHRPQADAVRVRAEP